MTSRNEREHKEKLKQFYCGESNKRGDRGLPETTTYRLRGDENGIEWVGLFY